MQERSPAFVFGQVLSHMTGKKNVAAVAAIHHPLCRVDAASGYVGAFVHVHYTTDGSTVNAHSNLQARIVLERAADLHRTLRRFLRTLVENQRHAVAGGDLRSEEHTSELQSHHDLVCRLLLEKKKKTKHLLIHKKKKKIYKFT